ncbi:unnamed protein product [Closterium sp. NIES-54]
MSQLKLRRSRAATKRSLRAMVSAPLVRPFMAAHSSHPARLALLLVLVSFAALSVDAQSSYSIADVPPSSASASPSPSASPPAPVPAPANTSTSASLLLPSATGGYELGGTAGGNGSDTRSNGSLISGILDGEYVRYLQGGLTANVPTSPPLKTRCAPTTCCQTVQVTG